MDVSRAETGEDHERAVVIDSYELIIGEERKPMVVVEFEDGERKYMTAATPNVLPVYEETEEAGEPTQARPATGARARGSEPSRTPRPTRAATARSSSRRRRGRFALTRTGGRRGRRRTFV